MRTCRRSKRWYSKAAGPRTSRQLDGVAAIVIACDGNNLLGPESNWKALDEIAKKGVGIAYLHYALDPGNKPGKYLLNWIGGYYEQFWSVNPSWLADFKALPRHPILAASGHSASRTNGTITCDSWRSMEGVTPILSAVPPDSTRKGPDGPHSGNPTVRARMGMAEHVAWAYERPRWWPRLRLHRRPHALGLRPERLPQADAQRRLLDRRVEVPPDGVATQMPTAERWNPASRRPPAGLDGRENTGDYRSYESPVKTATFVG